MTKSYLYFSHHDIGHFLSTLTLYIYIIKFYRHEDKNKEGPLLGLLIELKMNDIPNDVEYDYSLKNDTLYMTTS